MKKNLPEETGPVIQNAIIDIMFMLNRQSCVQNINQNRYKAN